MDILALPVEIVSCILTLYVADCFQNLGRKSEDGGNSPMEVVKAVRQLELVCKPFSAIMHRHLGFFELMGVRLQYVDAKLALCVLCASFSQAGDRKEKLDLAIAQRRYSEDRKGRVTHDIQQISDAIAAICSPAFINTPVDSGASGTNREVNLAYIVGPIMGTFVILAPPSFFRRSPPRISSQEIRDPLTREDVQVLFRALCRYLLLLRETGSSDKIDIPVEELSVAVSTIRPGSR